MNTLTKTQSTTIQHFADLILRGIEAWIEAGKIVVEEVDKNPLWADWVCDKFPKFSHELVMRFYAIGKKQLHPELLISDCPAFKRLIRLPYGTQEKYLTEPCELLIKSEDGWETLQTDIRNLTAQQAAQLIDKDHIRSPAAQRAFLESKNAEKFHPAIERDSPYKVVGRKVIVKRDVTLSAKDLVQMLSMLES